MGNPKYTDKERKEIKRLYDMEYRRVNREKRNAQATEWRLNNKNKTKEYNKTLYDSRTPEEMETEKSRLKLYRETNQEHITETHKKWVTNNKDKIRVIEKKYRDNNKEKISEGGRIYRANNLVKLNNYRKVRRRNEPLYRLKHNIRCLIRQSLSGKGLRKNSLSEQILGCTYSEFKTHLESQWEAWMNWDNYGLYDGELNYGWDIDHIIPMVSALTEDEAIRLNNYTNLQPLCSYTNRHIKRDLY